MSQTSPGYGGRSPLSDLHAFHYVYILRCNDGKLYTGITQNLDDRLGRHHDGYVPSTKLRRPLSLITYFAFADKYRAFEFENYLKSGSGRAFASKRLV